MKLVEMNELSLEKMAQSMIDGFNEGVEKGISNLKKAIDPIFTRAVIYEKNREAKSLFALSDEIPTHAIIKAFLLSDQNIEDLEELMIALKNLVFSWEYEDFEALNCLREDHGLEPMTFEEYKIKRTR